MEADIQVYANFPNDELQLLSCLSATYEEFGYTVTQKWAILVCNTALLD